METKSVFYAAVGAPVVAVRRVSGVVSEQVSTLKDKVGEEKATYAEAAQKAIDGWAVEGEKVVSKVSEKKVVEEISSKVDLDQAREQVTKLRDQLEDMLATWKSSFRPEKDGVKAEPKNGEKEAAKPAEEEPEAQPTTEKADAKASAAKTTKSTSAKDGESDGAAEATKAS